MASIATVGEHRTPIIIKDFGMYEDGTRYAVCNINSLDVDIPVMLELINIETINDCK